MLTSWPQGVKYISHVLPIYDSSTHPYKILAKLVLDCPVLLSSITSMAAEYLYYLDRKVPIPSSRNHDQALNSFRHAIARTTSWPYLSAKKEEPTANEATLASVLLQIANAAFTGASGVDVHLACAMHFIPDLGCLNNPVGDSMSRILVQRFAKFDVITAILRHRRPHLPQRFWLFEADDEYDAERRSLQDMSGCPQPLLGFFNSLANMIADLYEESKLAFEIFTIASQWETDMRMFERALLSSIRQEIVNPLDTVTQCYYWTAHLILHRVVYRDLTTSPRLQHTVSTIVDLLRSIPIGSGTDYSLLFPFYISSKEAIASEHRAWVTNRIQQMKHVYPGRSIDLLVALLEDIWRVVDEAKERIDPAASKECDIRIRELERRRDLCFF